MTSLQKFYRRHPELVDPYRIPVSPLVVVVSNNILRFGFLERLTLGIKTFMTSAIIMWQEMLTLLEHWATPSFYVNLKCHSACSFVSLYSNFS